MDIRLREATTQDADFIYQLVEKTMRGYVEQLWGSFSEAYNRKHIAEAIPGRSYSIISLGGQDIGAMAVERHATHIHLTQIYLLPSHQNCGIGTRLVRELIREANQSRKPLRLSVLSVNPARRLYEREGFSVVSETRERCFMELLPPHAAVGLERGKVRLLPYQSAWPALFEAEAARLRGLCGPALVRIEHVGSTSIPGVDSKPIVDMMACVRDMRDAVALILLLEANGYEHRPDDSWDERVFLAHGPRSARTHHLSFTTEHSRFWTDHLLFRDHLRTHPAEAAAYCELKRELARRFPEDRRAYTDAKEAFVMRVLSAARNAT